MTHRRDRPFSGIIVTIHPTYSVTSAALFSSSTRIMGGRDTGRRLTLTTVRVPLLLSLAVATNRKRSFFWEVVSHTSGRYKKKNERAIGSNNNSGTEEKDEHIAAGPGSLELALRPRESGAEAAAASSDCGIEERTKKTQVRCTRQEQVFWKRKAEAQKRAHKNRPA